MKKRLSYRDKLLELAYIYNVQEIQDYTKNRKNLTTGQIELILKKQIVIPKEFKTNFKENFVKPVTKLKSYHRLQRGKIKDKNRFIRRVENYKYDTSRKFNHGVNNLWRSIGSAGINLLNVLPKLGITVTSFFGKRQMYLIQFTTNKLTKKVRNVIIGFFVIIELLLVSIQATVFTKNGIFSEKKRKQKSQSLKLKKKQKSQSLKLKKKQKSRSLKLKRKQKSQSLK